MIVLQLGPEWMWIRITHSRQVTCSISTRTTGSLWRPAALPSRQPILRCLALKVPGRLDELRPIHVVEGIHVDHGISSALDHACRRRHHAACQAEVKIRGLRSKPIARHPGVVGDPQRETAIGMRGPDGPVLCAQGAAAGANRDRRPGIGPVERNADVSTMTASVNPAIGDWFVHVDRPWLMIGELFAKRQITHPDRAA
jgi:hypothetical protein